MLIFRGVPKKTHTENKLLLISINFTPKNSNPVAYKNATNSYVFQAHAKICRGAVGLPWSNQVKHPRSILIHEHLRPVTGVPLTNVRVGSGPHGI